MFLELLFLSTALAWDYRRHVPNSVIPFYLPSYNVKHWAEELHLQQCSIVQIGENFAALFVEFRPHNASDIVQEFFLGICDMDTLFGWSLCSAEVERLRPNDCLLSRNVSFSARVHRRLCDLTMIVKHGERCNCSYTLSRSPLIYVEGFPTCFQWPFPGVLCGSNNVCGIEMCSGNKISQRIYTIACNPLCFEQNPFCETMEFETSLPAEIDSFWSDWTNPQCIDPACEILITEAVCINKNSGLGDIDCLGPGTSCCPLEEHGCQCRIFNENGVLRILKTFQSSPTYWQRTSERYLEQYVDYGGHSIVKRQADYIEDDDDEPEMGEHEEDISIEEDTEEARLPKTTTDSVELSELNEKSLKIANSSLVFDESTELSPSSQAKTSCTSYVFEIVSIIIKELYLFQSLR